MRMQVCVCPSVKRYCPPGHCCTCCLFYVSLSMTSFFFCATERKSDCTLQDQDIADSVRDQVEEGCHQRFPIFRVIKSEWTLVSGHVPCLYPFVHACVSVCMFSVVSVPVVTYTGELHRHSIEDPSDGRRRSGRKSGR